MEPVTVEALRSVATLQGYAWSDAEIEAIRLQVSRGLLQVEKLETLSLRETEPAIQYRMF
jgi:hypothetical protein